MSEKFVCERVATYGAYGEIVGTLSCSPEAYKVIEPQGNPAIVASSSIVFVISWPGRSPSMISHHKPRRIRSANLSVHGLGTPLVVEKLADEFKARIGQSSSSTERSAWAKSLAALAEILLVL